MAKVIADGLELAEKLCDVLGIEYEQTLSVDIQIRPSEPVRVIVEKWLLAEQEKKIIDLIK